MIQSLIVAASANDVIGNDGSLPWVLPEDLRRFRSITKGHALIMGRKTYESILARLGHPLRDRTSIVLTSSRDNGRAASVLWANSLESAISMARDVSASAMKNEFFIAGGASVYGQAVAHSSKVYLTRVHQEFDGDTTMPPDWLRGFQIIGRSDSVDRSADCSYSFLEYLRETN